MLLAATLEEPLLGLPAAFDAAVIGPLSLLLADPDADIVLVLEATLPSLAPSYSGPPEPLLVSPALALDSEAVDLTTIYLSDSGWKTGPGETPANRYFKPVLTSPYNFESSIALDGSGASSSFGVIEIANRDGALDDLLDYAWTGRDVTVKIGGTIKPGRFGERRLTYDEFGTLFVGRVAGVRADRARIELALRDPMTRLETPAQTSVYGGTGGREGGADLGGLPRPLGFGMVRQAAPPLLDAFHLVYQLHDGAIAGVSAVRDKGVALSAGVDYATYELLIAATVTAGTYATCLAEAMVRLGAQPAGQVTADFQGDASGGYVSTAGAIIRRLVTTRGAEPLRDPDEIDAVAFGELESAAPQVVHSWTGTEARTVAELVRELAASIGGFVTFDRQARLTAAVFDAPAMAPAVTHGARTIVDGDLAVERIEPVWRWSLGYRRNNAPQSPDALASSLTAEERQAYSQAERFATHAAETVASLHRAARDLRASTQLDEEADAAAETERRIARDRVPRELRTIEIKRPLFQSRLGETHALELDRFGLQAGRNYVVVRLAEDGGRRRVTLGLWG